MNIIKCRGCGETIHPMRLEILPNTKVCVKCSREGRKTGRLVTLGRGEDIETVVEILDGKVGSSVHELERLSRQEILEQDLDFLKSSDEEDDEDLDYKFYSNPEEDD